MEIASAAEGDVFLGSSNYFHCSLLRSAKSKRSVSTANPANGWEFRYWLWQRHQFQHVAKGFPLKSTIESCNNDYLSAVTPSCTEWNQVGKELAFIDSNDVISRNFIINVGQVGGTDRLPSYPVGERERERWGMVFTRRGEKGKERSLLVVSGSTVSIIAGVIFVFDHYGVKTSKIVATDTTK